MITLHHIEFNILHANAAAIECSRWELGKCINYEYEVRMSEMKQNIQHT